MESRRIVILKLLASIFGGAVLTPALLCALPLIIPSSDRVPGSTIPALASIGAVYGGFCGILWAYRPTMDNNRVAQVLYTVGFMLGGAFGFILGLLTASTNLHSTILNGVIGIFVGSAAAILLGPALRRKLNN
jgi:hypothetical protein